MTEPNPSAEPSAPSAEPSAGRIVIVMPTYNERQNLESIAGRVRTALPAADLLVVDDNSPDGTGDIADKLAEADPHVQVMHRTEKAGLGKAYIAGFGWALERGYDVIVEMDADGSHQPEHLPSLVGALDHADLSIGSRWVRGGKVVNWPKSREALSRAANIYTRLMLGLSVRDATAGFRAYRAATLRTISLSQVESTGYCFQIDLTIRVAQAGLRIVEVPITFVEREHGASKMSNSIIMEAFWRVAQWGVARRLRQLSVARSRGQREEPAYPADKGSWKNPAGWASLGLSRRLGAPAVRAAGVLAAVGAPALPDDLKALGEHGLEILDRAALHEHVPVAARRLGLLRRRGLPGGRDRDRAADTALPRRGKFRLGGERHAKMMPVRAVEGDVLTGRQVGIPVVFVARRTEPGAAKCAFGHACCLPGGQRSYRATLNTRTRFPLRALPNRISAERSRLPAPEVRCYGPRGCH